MNVGFETADGEKIIKKQAKWLKTATKILIMRRWKEETGRNIDLCIFCEVDSSKSLHEFRTLSASKSISQMATEMRSEDWWYWLISFGSKLSFGLYNKVSKLLCSP